MSLQDLSINGYNDQKKLNAIHMNKCIHKFENQRHCPQNWLLVQQFQIFEFVRINISAPLVRSMFVARDIQLQHSLHILVTQFISEQLH